MQTRPCLHVNHRDPSDAPVPRIASAAFNLSKQPSPLPHRSILRKEFSNCHSQRSAWRLYFDARLVATGASGSPSLMRLLKSDLSSVHSGHSQIQGSRQLSRLDTWTEHEHDDW